MRLMVIEDNPADIELLRMALDGAKFPYELTLISDGAEALATFGKINDEAVPVPDLTLLDLNLPRYDGLEVLEALRSRPRLAAMPVVVLTSSSSPRERSRLQAFEHVTYIRKPSELDQYLSIGPLIRDLWLGLPLAEAAEG